MSGEQRSNVLFIVTDDQRYGTIAALGNRYVRTPNMDRLVQEGTALEGAHIMGSHHAAVCMPSRAMMLTGRNLFSLEKAGEDIPKEQLTMPECFRKGGYATFGTGKWHNGPGAYTRSFSDGGEIMFGGMADHWNVPLCDFSQDGNYPPESTILTRWNSTRHQKQGVRWDHFGRRHSTELISDETIDFLLHRRPSDRSFFAYTAFLAPHDPREMPAEFLQPYLENPVPVPHNFLSEHPFDNGDLTIRDELLAEFPRSEPEISRHLAEYYAMIAHVDHELGRILSALERTGQYDNTIKVLVGDNGLAVGSHGLMGKQNLYDHSVRVPLIMAGPGIQSGGRISALCFLQDIFPTLCELSGISIPATVEGKSLLPSINGETAGHRDHLLLAYKGLQRAVTDGHHKLIEYVVNGEHSEQLFDLVEDPDEMVDRSGDLALEHVKVEMKRRLAGWKADHNDSAHLGERFWEVADQFC